MEQLKKWGKQEYYTQKNMFSLTIFKIFEKSG